MNSRNKLPKASNQTILPPVSEIYCKQTMTSLHRVPQMPYGLPSPSILVNSSVVPSDLILITCLLLKFVYSFVPSSKTASPAGVTSISKVPKHSPFSFSIYTFGSVPPTRILLEWKYLNIMCILIANRFQIKVLVSTSTVCLF